MDNNQVLKVITPVKCPECSKMVYVCQQQMPAGIAWVLEEGAIKQAKEEVRKEIEKTEDEAAKKNMLKWLDDENTVFGPDDVLNIIEQMQGTTKNKDESKD